ncbi:hypothetical protein F8388_027139 [Cannabis sativa]|uniref:Uncharacterized protein n=1 Tax=Cannabis sativa TaxID=3483 RepID=A0A7J6HXQ4_CANSA|nr:hypothetical protein F8388_027139 [Cannabis sativa]KAF4399639.1 hypothetical protein G4B88_022722 [Cannabis sativa]
MPRFTHFHNYHTSSTTITMSGVMPFMVESVVRLVMGLLTRPTSTITTLLYYSNLLPRNLNLERLVQHEFIDPPNYLFHFIINVLRCF